MRQQGYRRNTVLAIAAIVAAGVCWAVAAPNPGKSAKEKRIMEVLEFLYAHQREGMMNITPQDGRLLRVLTEATDARHVVEIGTSNGYSGIWFCLALQATGGKLTTHEVDAGRATLARENFKKAGVESIVTLVEGDAHENVLKITEPIDILFLDADKGGYIDYLEKLLPKVKPGGLILAHNTSDLKNLLRPYVDYVKRQPELETIFLHEHDRGIGVSLKKR